jgi:streptogramin lyase
MPDGLTVDAEAFLWCSHWFGGCITHYDPDGKRERRVRTPAAQTSSLVFGGPDLDKIYVTSAAMSNCLILAPGRLQSRESISGGPLCRFRAGIQGKLKFRSRVRSASKSRQ